MGNVIGQDSYYVLVKHDSRYIRVHPPRLQLLKTTADVQQSIQKQQRAHKFTKQQEENPLNKVNNTSPSAKSEPEDESINSLQNLDQVPNPSLEQTSSIKSSINQQSEPNLQNLPQNQTKPTHQTQNEQRRKLLLFKTKNNWASRQSNWNEFQLVELIFQRHNSPT